MYRIFKSKLHLPRILLRYNSFNMIEISTQTLNLILYTLVMQMDLSQIPRN